HAKKETPMKPLPHAVLALAIAVTLAACASAPSQQAETSSATAPATHNASTAKQAIANLASASGSLVSGRLTLAPMGNGVHITGEIGGLQAGSSHGFHIHEKGDCSAVDAS